MSKSLRHEIRLLRFYAAASSLAFVGMMLMAATRPAEQLPRELTVERINITEPDGTVKMVIADTARAPDQVMDGKSTPRTSGNRAAGITFFNDEGDEAGGLKVRGGIVRGTRSANGHLLFDQYKNDQTIGLVYDENAQGRSAGLQIWDRPDTPLPELLGRINAAAAQPAGPLREQAQREIREAEARGEFGASRLFAGKTRAKDAMVVLSDAQGRPRLRLVVAVDGEPRIEFLDDKGTIVRRLTSAVR
jgi:hypothetical protein